MKAPPKLLFLVGAVALLSSCSPPGIDIAFERVGGRLLLRLSQNWGLILSDRRVPCVYRVSIHKPEVHEKDKAAWVIEAEGDVQCIKLESVTVGEVPKGWREVVPLTVAKGQTYTVEGWGIGEGRRNVRF